ncbi:unnamed protein product [Closterium sp. NIES-54]
MMLASTNICSRSCALVRAGEPVSARIGNTSSSGGADAAGGGSAGVFESESRRPPTSRVCCAHFPERALFGVEVADGGPTDTRTVLGVGLGAAGWGSLLQEATAGGIVKAASRGHSSGVAVGVSLTAESSTVDLGGSGVTGAAEPLRKSSPERGSMAFGGNGGSSEPA